MLSVRSARQERGYTTAELMFVVLVLGILVSIAIATYFAATNRANSAACMANRRVLRDAVAAYQVEYDGSLPATLPEVGPFIVTPDTFFRCPSDRTTAYGYDPTTGQIDCPLHP